MSLNNHMVAHVWANASKPRGRSSNGNFHFEGDTIYSYSTPIAKRYPNCTLVTSERYSVTTSGKHMPAIHRALSGVVFYVPSIGERGWDTPDHAANLKHFQDTYYNTILKAGRARDRRSVEWLCQAAKRIACEASQYAATFGLKNKAWLALVTRFETKDCAEVNEKWRARDAKANTPEAIAKRERAEAAREAKRQRAAEIARLEAAERAALWLAGNLDVYYRSPYGQPALLRVRGDVLETSQGANVPLEHAIRAFRFIMLVRERGEVWETNGHRLPVGHFQVDRIEANGDIKAGCHVIEWAEIARIAKQLGLME